MSAQLASPPYRSADVSAAGDARRGHRRTRKQRGAGEIRWRRAAGA